MMPGYSDADAGAQGAERTDEVPWSILTRVLDELDQIRTQVRDSRAQRRGARFYSLIRIREINRAGGGRVGDVVELTHGWVILHWLHDPKSVALYSSIQSARTALCEDGIFLLALEDESERRHERTALRTVLKAAELAILTELSHGRSNGEIGQTLGMAQSTVKNHLTRVFHKLGVADRTQAALMARDLDLLPPTGTDR